MMQRVMGMTATRQWGNNGDGKMKTTTKTTMWHSKTWHNNQPWERTMVVDKRWELWWRTRGSHGKWEDTLVVDMTQQQPWWLTRGGSGQERQLWRARGGNSCRQEEINVKCYLINYSIAVWWWQQAVDGMGKGWVALMGFVVLEFPCIFSFCTLERGNAGERKTRS